MGALFHSPPSPPPIPVQPPAAAPATFATAPTQAAMNPLQAASSAVNAGGDIATGGAANSRRKAAGGIAGTIGTSPQGLQEEPHTANATLLGASS